MSLAVLLFVPGMFLNAETYKESFSAHLTGAGAASSTDSMITGHALFNVFSDESQIDYELTLDNAQGVTEIVLGCGAVGTNGPTVAQLFHTSTPAAGQPSRIQGSLFEPNLYDWAENCNPTISTTAHVAESMRQGGLYVNVFTSTYPEGEVRGQLTSTSTAPFPTPGDTGTTTATSTPPTDTGTTTPPTTGGGENATSTATSTPGLSSEDENETRATPIPGGRRRSIVGLLAPQVASQGVVLGAFTGPTASCNTYFSDYYFPGRAVSVASVQKLQTFLNTEMNAGLTLNGNYDAATIAAVNAFQLKYAHDILTPWVNKGLLKTATPTGTVYKRTLWKINQISCPGMSEAAPKV